MDEKQSSLKRSEIRAVLKRHQGSIVEIARGLGIRSQNVSKWLRGQTVSARIEAAAHAKARFLLQEEKVSLER